jgi:hypothetical protein
MPEINGLVASDEATPEAETVDCEYCGATVESDSLFHNERLGLAVCETCDLDHPEVFECDHCGREHDHEDEAYDCCRFTCPECGTEYRYEEEAMDCCQHRCPECGDSHYSEEDALACCRRYGSNYPALSDLDPYLISVPEIEGRPARVCSIEQEINEGGSQATRMLYDFGFADSPEQQGYSSAGRPGRAIVKSDASLSGDDSAEIVYSRFRLWEDGSVRDLSGALGRMRQLAREANVVRVNKSAGTHIHVSATAEDGTRIGPVQMAALHEIFCYAEDFLYSMAAAGWDDHRTSPGSHHGYCKPVPKIPSGQKATGFRVNGLMSRDRYFGLNFQRLIGAANNCSCGAARFGEWAECECGAFDQATVEWRLFNASTKPETLHAWLILAHALTALAFSHTVGTLPANEYGSSDLEGRMAVQTWIETNAPLTDDELQVIRAATRNAPGLGKPRKGERR